MATCMIDRIEGCAEVSWKIAAPLRNCFNQGNDVSEEIAAPLVYRLIPQPLLHAFACRESAEKGCILVLKSLGFPSHTVSFVGSPFSIFHSPFSILH